MIGMGVVGVLIEVGGVVGVAVGNDNTGYICVGKAGRGRTRRCCELWATQIPTYGNPGEFRIRRFVMKTHSQYADRD